MPWFMAEAAEENVCLCSCFASSQTSVGTHFLSVGIVSPDGPIVGGNWTIQGDSVVSKCLYSVFA